MAKSNGNPHVSQAQQPQFAAVNDQFNDFYAGYSKMFGEFGKMFGNGRAPMFDMAALLDAQRKNIDALSAANRLALEGVQAVAQRQGELFRQAVQNFSGVTREIAAEASPEQKFARQAEFAKASFEDAVSNFGEIADLAQKSGAQALAVINKRIVENFDDVKSTFATAAAAK
jgi:phasin family protein